MFVSAEEPVTVPDAEKRAPAPEWPPLVAAAPPPEAPVQGLRRIGRGDEAEAAPYEMERTSPGTHTAPSFAAVGARLKTGESSVRVPRPEPTAAGPPPRAPTLRAGEPKPPTVRPMPMPATGPPPQAVAAAPAAPAVSARGGHIADATRACAKCGAAVPTSFAFCGRCGAPVGAPAAAENLGQTQFFGALQAVGKAKLVLIKGEGIDGISYQLNAQEHVAGRSDGVILFPDDRFLSARHANFFYREGKLFLRDEGSLNGVFLRIREPVTLADGDVFLAGEELLRFEVVSLPRPAEMVSEDGTVFYGTPLRDGAGCRIVQILLGGRMGMVYVPTKPQVLVGRESCDLSFPRDRFISGRHCKLELQGRSVVLSDLGSKNGTYVRLRDERELRHGDYVFLGQQLFRVEITAF
jgi:pSer/pThr/pTyr-binding forkhead associated (FHA) protein